jgi:hypothetical protein
MALFIDGPPSDIEDLTAHDSQLLEMACAENIDVTRKLVLAYEQTGIEVEGMLRRYVTAPRIDQVVVTPVLRLWHTYRTLHLVYSDAFHNQLNDRYAAKRDQFGQKAQQACNTLMEIGIGMTPEPVPQAATPGLVPASGFLADGCYFVTMTWVNRTGEEGAAAIPASIGTAGSSFLVQPGPGFRRERS